MTATTAIVTAGSPPRLRGEESVALFPDSTLGITPAPAGRSPFSAAELAFIWDHPRACGEKTILPGYVSSSTGSPPRLRGEEG